MISFVFFSTLKSLTRVVHETLNRLLGVKSVKERRLAIFRTRPVPSDLDGVWQAMGLNP